MTSLDTLKHLYKDLETEISEERLIAYHAALIDVLNEELSLDLFHTIVTTYILDNKSILDYCLWDLFTYIVSNRTIEEKEVCVGGTQTSLYSWHVDSF